MIDKMHFIGLNRNVILLFILERNNDPKKKMKHAKC